MSIPVHRQMYASAICELAGLVQGRQPSEVIDLNNFPASM